jgi:hypothetical protein
VVVDDERRATKIKGNEEEYEREKREEYER